MLDIQSLFPSSINPDSISVYLGRVISLDENFQDNGYLYVDLVDPNSTDLDKGSKTSNRARATFAIRNLYNCWERPPEIKSKTNFMGSMSMTTSGDFHLRNYCFDVQTLTWFTTVSTALTALGVVLVPPTMISLDTTPLPGKAVSVNVALAAKETVEEAIDDSTRNLNATPKSSSSNTRGTRSIVSSKVKPNLQTVKQKLTQLKSNSGGMRKAPLRSGSNDPNDVIAKIIKNITDPIEGIIDKAFKPYYQFINCINLLFQIYEKQLDAIDEITWPITTFSDLATAAGSDVGNDISTKLAIKNKLKSKINKFTESIPNPKALIPTNMMDTITEALYEPLNYMYTTVSNIIDDIVSPIKNKIKNIIATYVKGPLSSLTGFIAMSIQPAVSSLPTIVQVIVKIALKKLLKVLLGKPIKFILNKVVSPIENLIDLAAKAMKDKVSEVFCDAVNAVIKPLIKPIQTSITEMIPSFSMDAMEHKLTDIQKGVEDFPDIYIGIDPLHPYKKFVDINWSDSNEVACMLHTLIQETDLPSDWTPSVIELTEIVDSISFQDKTSPTPTKVNSDPEHPDYAGPAVEDDPDPVPKPIPGETTFIEKKFDSKEEFMPIFLKQHPPFMVYAKLGVGMFKDYGYEEGKKNPDKWITNGMDYVTTDTGEQYIVTPTDGTEVFVLYPKEDDGEEVGVVSLEKGFVYETTEVSHITNNDDSDTVVEGTDLIPKVRLYEGKLIPVKLQIQDMNESGELLYYTNNPPNEKQSDTYENIVQQYLRDKTEVESLLDYLNSHIPGSELSYIQDLLDRINALSNRDQSYIEDAVRESALYSLLTTLSNYNKDPEGIIVTRNIMEGETVTSIAITPDPTVDLFKLFAKEFPTDNIIVIDIYNDRDYIPANNVFNPASSSSPKDGYQRKIFYEIVLTKQSDNTYGDFQFIPQMEYYDVIEEQYNYKWLMEGDTYENLPNPLFATSYTLQTKDPENLYIRVRQDMQKTGEKIVAEDQSNPDRVEKGLFGMLSDAIYAFGQDSEFSFTDFIGSLQRKTMGVLSPLADSVEGVEKTVDSTLETLDELQKVNDMIGAIQEVGAKIKEISDTAKPALEAAANAASAAALMQSCSMSQSAKKKDFTFTSGDDYDLSTTTDSRLQLPYCKELNREHFLEPNCKVLVLAVGAGKQNLYVVDILS